MKDYLLCGVGVHHAGMLPFLKETVELLYQEGLVKILFATETFAIGINMPTRTVVFASLTKWDGTTSKWRELSAAEYIQMSGRAGRRNIDTSGTVIIMAVPECPERATLRHIMCSGPDLIESQFQLTFFMLLNMMSVGRNPADVVWNSFKFWGRQSPDVLKEQLARLGEVEEVARWDADQLKSLLGQCEELVKLTLEHAEDRAKELAKQGNPEKGQVLVVGSDTLPRRLAVVLESSDVDRDAWQRARHTVLVLSEPDPTGGQAAGGDGQLARRAAAVLRPQLVRPAADGTDRVPAHERQIIGWSDVESVLRRPDTGATEAVSGDMSAVHNNVRQREMSRFAADPPSSACAAVVRRLVSLSEDGCPASSQLVPPEPSRLVELRDQLREQFRDTETAELPRTLETTFSAGRLYHQLDELADWQDNTTAMVRVLQELGFVDSNGEVTGKGRATCGVGYRQLLVTELVFSGALSALSPAELAALLSAVSHALSAPASVRQEPMEAVSGVPPALFKGVERLIGVARKIDMAQRGAGLQATVAEEEQLLLFDLVPAVLGWARGDALRQLQLPERSTHGDLCRSLQRLDETLRDVRDLAMTLCLPELQASVREALVAIRRGLPFKPSIHTLDVGQRRRVAHSDDTGDGQTEPAAAEDGDDDDQQ